MFSLSDYHYSLPPELIAQEAIHPHHDARVMVIDRETGKLQYENTFWNIDQYLGDDRVIFFNDSRVLRSRVILSGIAYTRSDATQSVLRDGEIFYLASNTDDTFDALVRPGNKFRVGTIFEIGEFTVEVIGLTEAGRSLRLRGGDTIDFLNRHGSLPLPPYITYSREKEADYQTSFARADGSVAAPTASLHFTRELMDKIPNRREFLTLHVGLGTFKGISTADIRDYDIHRESVEISTSIFDKIAKIKTENKKIVAVGTTTTRTLESLPYLWRVLDQDLKNTIDANTRNYWDTFTERLEKHDWIHNIVEYNRNSHFSEIYQKQEARGSSAQRDSKGAYEPVSNGEVNFLSDEIPRGSASCEADADQIACTARSFSEISFETSIYITPGYIFNIVDDLVTNFHLGESSLLVLVSAFLGYEETMTIYRHAVENQYRFYSFGDGMYIRSK